MDGTWTYKVKGQKRRFRTWCAMCARKKLTWAYLFVDPDKKWKDRVCETCIEPNTPGLQER